MTGTSSYTYNTQPHAAPRLLSQTMPEKMVPLTMMSDPRVIRGNTHSLARKISKARADESQKMASSINLQQTFVEEPKSRPTYFYQAKEIFDKELDMFKYLVEEETFVPQKECETQSDNFLPPIPEPTFIPLKTGIDKGTQVEDTNDLFNFDAEVEPILKVIVQKTLEQALVEVHNEYELLNLQTQAKLYEEQQELERKWIKEHEIVIKNEQEKLRHQLNDLILTQQKETSTKTLIAGLNMIRQIMPDMIEKISKNNIKTGVWVLPEVEELRSRVMPSLLNEVVSKYEVVQEAKVLVDELLKEAEEKFLAIEPIAKTQKNINLKISFKKVIESTGEADEEGNAQTNVSSQDIFEVKYLLGPQDTIATIESKLRKNIKAFNNPNSENPEETNPNAITGDIKLLPQINILISSLYTKKNLPSINITSDCCLLNYPFDSDISITINL